MKRFLNIVRKTALILIGILLLCLCVVLSIMAFSSSALVSVIRTEKGNTALPTKVLEYSYKNLDGQDKLFKVTLIDDEFIEKNAADNKANIQQDGTNIYALIIKPAEGFGDMRLVAIKKETGEQAELIASGDLKSQDSTASLNNVGYLSGLFMSDDKKELYITENFGGPGHDVIVFDLQSGRIREATCSGALFGTVNEGPFRGYILVDIREHSFIDNTPFYVRSLVNPKNCLLGIPLGIMPESY